jgi:hypothetical protein
VTFNTSNLYNNKIQDCIILRRCHEHSAVGATITVFCMDLLRSLALIVDEFISMRNGDRRAL